MTVFLFVYPSNYSHFKICPPFVHPENSHNLTERDTFVPTQIITDLSLKLLKTIASFEILKTQMIKLLLHLLEGVFNYKK